MTNSSTEKGYAEVSDVGPGPGYNPPPMSMEAQRVTAENDYTATDVRELQTILNGPVNAYTVRRKRELLIKAGAVTPPVGDGDR